MLFTAASRGFHVIDGFLVFLRVRVMVRVKVRVREAFICGPLAMAALAMVALSYNGHESMKQSTILRH